MQLRIHHGNLLHYFFHPVIAFSFVITLFFLGTCTGSWSLECRFSSTVLCTFAADYVLEFDNLLCTNSAEEIYKSYDWLGRETV